jgi:septal ring factor EnvC (AmiA/AmiB activator)
MLDKKVKSILKFYSEQQDLKKSYESYIETLKRRVKQEEDINKITDDHNKLLKAKIERLEATINNLNTQLKMKSNRGFFSRLLNL